MLLVRPPPRIKVATVKDLVKLLGEGLLLGMGSSFRQCFSSLRGLRLPSRTLVKILGGGASIREGVLQTGTGEILFRAGVQGRWEMVTHGENRRFIWRLVFFSGGHHPVWIRTRLLFQGSAHPWGVPWAGRGYGKALWGYPLEGNPPPPH